MAKAKRIGGSISLQKYHQVNELFKDKDGSAHGAVQRAITLGIQLAIEKKIESPGAASPSVHPVALAADKVYNSFASVPPLEEILEVVRSIDAKIDGLIKQNSEQTTVGDYSSVANEDDLTEPASQAAKRALDDSRSGSEPNRATRKRRGS